MGPELRVDLRGPAGVQVRNGDAESGRYIRYDDFLDGALLGHYTI